MTIKRQLSFSSGEIDPVLQDRVTLERFQKGLATARNCLITKTGAITSRFAREFKFQFSAGFKVKVFTLGNANKFIALQVNEAGDKNLLIFNSLEASIPAQTYDLSNVPPNASDYDLTLDNIDNIHAVSGKDYTYFFGGPNTDKYILRFKHNSISYDNTNISYGVGTFTIPDAPLGAVGSGTGSAAYEVDYAFTLVRNGEESSEIEYTSADDGPIYLPVNAGDENTFLIGLNLDQTTLNEYNEVRVYRRPAEGSAYGFIGRTNNIYLNGANEVEAKFVDFGQDADFGNGIPFFILEEGLIENDDISTLPVATGTIYQQRLLLGNLTGIDEQAILVSRPAYENNFQRDFPYDADSALKTKTGTTGIAKVLRMIDSDGIVAFTTAGVYVNTGILSPTNNVFTKRGGWIINDKIPPLVIPGGLFFVDQTNTVRQLIFSDRVNTYITSDQSVFSDHLFTEKTITSWAYQEGDVNLLVVCFSDGTFATFTYDAEHEMRAWTRHDSKWPVEQVESTNIPDTTIFVVNKNGTRHIEYSISKIISPSIKVANYDFDLLKYKGFMDEMEYFSSIRNVSLNNDDVFTLTPTTPDDWEGTLVLNCGTSNVFFPYSVGNTLRVFDRKDRNFYDLEITVKTDNNNVTVQPSEEYPSDQASGFNLYDLFTEINDVRLSHLEGEEVVVIADGNLVSSPYNDNPESSVDTLTVTSNTITLPEPAATVIIGLPIVADIKTLNVSTAEQRNLMIESMTLNKLYVNVYNTLGLFADNYFPEELVHEKDGTSVENMQDISQYIIPENIPFISNRAKPKTNERIEITLQGEYLNGQVAIRQVDPFHFTILSIISDLEVLNRSDR